MSCILRIEFIDICNIQDNFILIILFGVDKVKSNRINTALLVAMFLILPVVLILMFHHITLCETISKMNGGTFGDSSSIISFENSGAYINSFSDISKKKGSFAIFADSKTADGNVVRAIYFNDKYVNLPMKEGRFFNNSDFKTDDNIAVIGKKLEDNAFSENGNSYIYVNGIKYQVIGVLGYDEDTLFDDYIFINGNTANEMLEEKIYTLDIIKAKDSESFVSEIVDGLNNKGIKCELIRNNTDFSDKYLPKLLYSRLFVFVVALNLLALLLVSIQWINNQKRNYCIKRLIGASNLRIFVSLLIKYLIIIFLSCLVGLLYCVFFYSSYIYSLFLGYAVLIPLVILFLLISLISILREPIEEAIK